MNKALLILPTAALLLAVNAGTVQAAGTNYGTSQCQPIYGGGENCVKTPQFELNKTVQNPQTQSYVDNLGVSDPKYTATQTVTFKITVKNTSGETLTNLTLKDTLPNYVEYVSGTGTYDAKSKTLSMTLDKLEKNEVRDFFVQAKVVDASKLPSDESTTCVANQVTVTAMGKTAQDNAQFCIEKAANPQVSKGGLPVYPPLAAKTTPATGAESLALIGLIPSAIAGLALRRKSK